MVLIDLRELGEEPSDDAQGAESRGDKRWRRRHACVQVC